MAFDRARAVGLAQKVLRAVQAVFALIVLACAAKTISFNKSNDYWRFGSGSAGFMIFVSVTSMLAAVFFLAVSWMEQLHQKVAGAVEAGVSGLFVVFWLSASVTFIRRTSFCGDEENWAASAGYYGYEEAVQVLKDFCAFRSAAVAFGFLAWLLWMASTALAALDLRAGRGLRVAGLTPGATQGAPVKSVAAPGADTTPQQQVIYVPQPGAAVQYNQQPPMQYTEQPPMQYTQQPPTQAPDAQHTQQPPMEAPGAQYTQQPPIQPSTKTEV